jgi:hypothetical protein
MKLRPRRADVEKALYAGCVIFIFWVVPDAASKVLEDCGVERVRRHLCPELLGHIARIFV